jgi:dienelactone hydrolase
MTAVPAPIGLERRPDGSGDGYRREAWALAGSAGDRIPVEVSFPVTDPRAVAIVAHGATGSRESPHVRAAARALARGGVVALAPDAPHHGGRQGRATAADELRSRRFFDQAVGDLERVATAACDALPGLPLGYVGFSMGAITGIALLALRTDVQAAVLVVGGLPTTDEGPPGSGPDLLRLAGSITVTDVLMMQADRDEVFDRSSSFAVYDALACPKQILFFPGTHAAWTNAALRYRTIVHHLCARLGGA